jgi:CII-binding regulator of phage lambda lysogenization HflD
MMYLSGISYDILDSFKARFFLNINNYQLLNEGLHHEIRSQLLSALRNMDQVESIPNVYVTYVD